jgi:hypothetical protein
VIDLDLFFRRTNLLGEKVGVAAVSKEALGQESAADVAGALDAHLSGVALLSVEDLEEKGQKKQWLTHTS